MTENPTLDEAERLLERSCVEHNNSEPITAFALLTNAVRAHQRFLRSLPAAPDGGNFDGLPCMLCGDPLPHDKCSTKVTPPPAREPVCPTCDGKGEVRCILPLRWEHCPRCRGTGKSPSPSSSEPADDNVFARLLQRRFDPREDSDGHGMTWRPHAREWRTIERLARTEPASSERVELPGGFVSRMKNGELRGHPHELLPEPSEGKGERPSDDRGRLLRIEDELRESGVEINGEVNPLGEALNEAFNIGANWERSRAAQQRAEEKDPDGTR